MGKVYRAIQEKYADRTQKERDWFFTRSLSQMGDYDNKEVFFLKHMHGGEGPDGCMNMG